MWSCLVLIYSNKEFTVTVQNMWHTGHFIETDHFLVNADIAASQQRLWWILKFRRKAFIFPPTRTVTITNIISYYNKKIYWLLLMFSIFAPTRAKAANPSQTVMKEKPMKRPRVPPKSATLKISWTAIRMIWICRRKCFPTVISLKRKPNVFCTRAERG